ncbi:unnamed protein product [Ranitomeya imitator]|uniref:Suppressor of tumorigenicity 7 protein n=1 Tax=Ranitomeya imitator TaxID=111125 RepID=A0ABN9M2R2_9NEOB|nr:unnamed protein product [Ranitomeya imitator]
MSSNSKDTNDTEPKAADGARKIRSDRKYTNNAEQKDANAARKRKQRANKSTEDRCKRMDTVKYTNDTESKLMMAHDGNQGKHRVTKRGPALSYPMFTLVTGIVGRWRAVCVTALQRPNSDAAAIRIVVGYSSVIKMHFGTNLSAGRFGGRTAHATAILEDGGAHGEDGQPPGGSVINGTGLSICLLEALGRRGCSSVPLVRVLCRDVLQKTGEDGSLQKRALPVDEKSHHGIWTRGHISFEVILMGLYDRKYPRPGSAAILDPGLEQAGREIFEWWYFRKYGTSFIEQVSVSHLRPLLGGVDSSTPSNSNTSNGDADSSRQSVSVSCSASQNVKSGGTRLNLFRGAEYNRYTWVTGREPLTYYDMNLSAQDHQTFFTCDTDHVRPADAIMQKAWRERNPQARISAAHEALELNECATAFILLAEEEATTIVEAEKLFKQALKAGEGCYRRSQQLQHHGTQYEAQHRRDTNVLVYIKRRLAMCARKLGRTREAVKMMRDLMKEFPLLSMFNIHENLLEALLELQAYADVQAVLAKYDDISLPKSATICYTAALLKARAVSDKFSPEAASRRGLSTAEMNAVEAIHRAVEFNPHVPKYLLEMKSLILPPEHILKRGDSEAIAYAFFHLQHWKRVEGALNLLHCTWEGIHGIKQTVGCLRGTTIWIYDPKSANYYMF